MVSLFFLLSSLTKIFFSDKMMIILMSFEMVGVFLFFLLSLFSPISVVGMNVSVCCIFLVMMVCESVIMLMIMISIYRKGSMMISSLYFLKF